MLGVSDYSKPEKNFVVGKVHHLVYFSKLYKTYLKIPRLTVMKAVTKAIHLEHMNEILKESRRNLYLD